MARSLEWYQRVFGFEILNRTKIDSGLIDDITGLSNASVDMVRGYVGNLLIELIETHCDGDLPAGRAPGTVTGVTVSVADVGRCHELSRTNGIDIQSPPSVFGDYSSMLIRDPDGVTFDLTDYQGQDPHEYLGAKEEGSR
jgi:catechol 2,3-dioxygenase-like lactoylglutathione lyase family enzyme